MGAVTKRVKSVGGLMASVVGTCFLANLFLGDQYLSLVIPGRMFKVSFEEAGLAPRPVSYTHLDVYKRQVWPSAQSEV